MLDLINNEFLSHNALRSYPFADGMSLRPSIDREKRLPDDFLVGATIVLTNNDITTNFECFFLQRLSVYPQGCALTIGYLNKDGSTIAVGRSIFSLISPKTNTTVIIEAINNFYGLQGHLTVGNFDTLLEQFSGDWTFKPEDTFFDPDVVNSTPRCVSSVVVHTADTISEPIYGEISFVEGDNINLEYYQSGTGIMCLKIGVNVKDTENRVTGPIYTINELPPSPTGDFQITSISNCLDVISGAGKIELRDVCSEPCCGCNELQVINNQIKNQIEMLHDIQALQRQLETQLEMLKISLAMS